ncbi:MAG: DUF6428 family protein [Putridiphycobacter sp.]
MKLSEFKAILKTKSTLEIKLPTGELVPRHFHVTEIGQVDKRFIDCGGKIRHEQVINFQLWDANDYDHRLHPEKLIHIIELSERKLHLVDAEIEVEFQGETIEKYGIGYENDFFVLTSKFTDCLAKDNCGVPPIAQKVASCCSSTSGCC